MNYLTNATKTLASGLYNLVAPAGTESTALASASYVDAFRHYNEAAIRQLGQAARCHLDVWLEDSRVLLTKASASDTVIVFGSLRVHDAEIDARTDLSQKAKDSMREVTLKISFPPKVPTKNGLEVERQIIRESFNYLLQNKYSPNVVAYFRFAECADGLDFGEQKQDLKGKDLSKKIKAVLPEDIEPVTSVFNAFVKYGKLEIRSRIPQYYVVMQRANRGALAELFERIASGELKHLSAEDLYGILVQVDDALACFYQLNIRHNDCHLGNILLHELESPELVTYEIPGRTFTLRVKYLVKFYDMDLGTVYVHNVDRNMTDDLILCEKAGVCNGPASKFDVAGFNMVLWLTLGDTIESPKISSAMKTLLLEARSLVAEMLGANNIKVYSDAEYPQDWMRYIAFPGKPNPKAVAEIKNPVECMQLLLDKTSVAVAGGAMGSVVYKLPPQQHIMLMEPTKALLGKHYYEGVHPLLTAMGTTKTPLIQDVFVRTKTQFKKNALKWVKTMNAWDKELEADAAIESLTAGQRPFSWEDAAYQLYIKWGVANGNRYPADRDFLFSCFLLTCPIYYGFPPSVREAMLNDYSDSNVILGQEQRIWTLFKDVLPVSIPILYRFD